MRVCFACPIDVEADDEAPLERIHAEVDRGFHALRDIEDGVSVFGSTTSPRSAEVGDLK